MERGYGTAVVPDLVPDLNGPYNLTCNIYPANLSDILIGILFGIYSDILFGICIRHIFWHSTWYYLVYLRTFFLVKFRGGTL